MAIEPQNLIQIQSELQDPALVTTQKLMEYANGTNPMVPSYLALIEMNRRKHIEDTSKAFDESNKATVKDQITSSLLAPKQFTNPAALPQGVNMGIAPPQVDPTANPFGSALTQQPNMINPAATPVQAADGGLMSIPVGHFKPENFAGGGIVAFSKGGKSDRYPEGNPDPDQYTHDKTSRLLPGAAPDYGLIAAAPDQTDAERRRLMREEQFARMTAGHPFLESAGTSLVNLPTDEPPAPPAGPKQTGFQGILSTLPPVQKPEQKSIEQLAEERKAVQRLAGVSADPYAESNKRMQAMEERQAKINEEAGLKRLLAQMAAFASADPSQGLAYAGAESVKASQALEKEQNALRDKQEMAQIEYARAVAKEEDARRNKDAEGILAAQAAQQKAQFDYQKAEHDRGMLAAHIYQTDEYAKARRDAANRAAEAKPDPDDVLFNRIMDKASKDPAYKARAKRLEELEVGTPEYNAELQELYRLMKPYFKQRPDLMPPTPELAKLTEAPKKQGFWESLFGGSGKPKTVSFEELPK